MQTLNQRISHAFFSLNTFGLALILVSVALADPAFAGQVYKYQDENGRWHFTDKKPKKDHSTVTFKAKPKAERPKLGRQPETDYVVAKNPWYAPVWFTVLDKETVVLEVLVPALSAQVLEQTVGQQAMPLTWRPSLSYRYLPGDPNAKFDGQPLVLPIAPLGKHQISQGFNGRFSHTNAANAYAVDIAMDVGSAIHAARAGVVVWVKDDYHMGGKDDFFLDKANLIRVLHSDGSFGAYVHILLGSARVKPGQAVKAGDMLAQAGSSGYSTGPHLHFSVHVNNGKHLVSVPFQFQVGNKTFTPKVKQWLSFK